MLAEVLRDIVRAVLGGGADISSLNPLPVTETAGGKGLSEVLNQATIAAGVTTTLNDCMGLNLGYCQRTLALTVEAMYDALATAGIRVHVISSYGDSEGGTHTGAMGAAVLTDAAAHFPIPNGLVGLTVNNSTDGSSGVITANTINTVTAVLAGGTANVWNTDDVYYINGAGYDTADFDTWSPAFAAGTFIRQTKPYLSDPGYLKVLIENLDLLQAVTVVTASFTWENRT
ncbi:hypothetical protein KKH23_09730 [Patescibacteria group bacterium]|nr:hypothetical protein [Patescibacteria group bacterium]